MTSKLPEQEKEALRKATATMSVEEIDNIATACECHGAVEIAEALDEITNERIN